MPDFQPFRALRYADTAELPALTSPPYDVVSPEQYADLVGGSPHNIAWVDEPAQTPEGYAESARLLAEWVADGTLALDPAPSLTIYRMSFVDASGRARETVGVLGGLEVVAEGAPGVLPHERVTPRDSTDRFDLTVATRANLSPVWGLSLASGLSALLAEPGEPMGEVVADEVVHRVERLTDPDRIAAIRQVLASDEVVIADGNHRYGVARAYQRLRGGGADPAPWDYTLAYVAELVPEQLSIEGIHRLYSHVCFDEVRGRLAAYFDIEPGPAPTEQVIGEMAARGALALVSGENPGRVEWLTPKPGAFDGLPALDGAWLERALEGSPAEVAYQHGLAEVLEKLPGYTAAVLIRPPSIAEIIRTARAHELMPPKSTFFTPKLRTGFVIRPLD